MNPNRDHHQENDMNPEKPIILWHATGRHACGHRVLEARDGRAYVAASCRGNAETDWPEGITRIAVNIVELPHGAEPLDPPVGVPSDFGDGASGMGDPAGCGTFYLSPEMIRDGQLPRRIAPLATGELALPSGAIDRALFAQAGR